MKDACKQAVILVMVLLIGGSACAETFPAKDIRLIVPFKPGGAVDTTSRIIAEFAQEHLDGAVIRVENRAGGGGVVGQTYAANADPDGYTILAMTSSVVTNPRLKQVEYEVSDFRAVALYTLDPEVIAVRVDSPLKSIADFIASSSKAPLSIAEAGLGTSHHLAGLAILQKSDLQLRFIHTRGFGSQLQALLGGHVDAALWSYGEAKPHVDAGTVRLLGVATDTPLENEPDLETWLNGGLKIRQWSTFRGWAVPAGTPDIAVQYLSDLLARVNQDPDYIEKMQAQGFPLAFRDSSGYTEVIARYDSLTKPVIDAMRRK